MSILASLILAAAAASSGQPSPHGLAPRASRQEGHRDEQLAPLAEAFAAYVTARRQASGLDAAKASLVRGLEALADTRQMGHPLTAAPALGRAAWLARPLLYRASKGLRDDKILEEALPIGSASADGPRLAFRLPKGYDPHRAYPLILAIPDVGETPAHHLRTHWSSSAVRAGAILVCPQMPSEEGEWSRVMVAGRPGGLRHVLAALGFAEQRFAVDPDRVFVAGRGKGVPAAVAAGNYSPQRFAGVIGRSGDPGNPDDPNAPGPENFSNLPTYFASGGGQSTRFQEALADLGVRNCERVPGAKEEDVWQWIRAQTREVTPETVRLQVGKPFPTRAYWLRVAPIAPDAGATATVDRESNSIRVSAHGVSWITIYLSDTLVDLNRPLTLVCNDREQVATVERSLSTTLDLLFDGTSDPSVVYVAQADVDLTGSAAAPAPASTEFDETFEQRLGAAGQDVGALWTLHEWCQANGQESGADLVRRRIVRLDPNHDRARAALGHVRRGEHWFPSKADLERYERSQEEALATSMGHVRVQSVWMHPDERAQSTRGRRKDPVTGLWTHAAERRKLEEGWVRQDLNWIPPEDAPQVDRGLWWVDGEWLELSRANRRHARLDSMWCIPDPQILHWSTADRGVALRAREPMRAALEDMRRVFGVQPLLPLSVAVLRDEEQYDRFAAGDPEGHQPPNHVGRLHTIQSACFAESWFPFVDGERTFRGMGFCYWDSFVPNGDLYGVHAARLATGLSYVEALDPSPKAVRKALADGPGPRTYADTQAEKQLPEWLRWGAAVYAERFFEDRTVAADGNRFWARAWSLENLAALGGRGPVAEVLAFEVDPEDREASLKLMIEAGLLVAFMLDGDCAPVHAAHEDLKEALLAGRSPRKAIEALTEALLDHEAELEAFAGL